jgi:hypothetical protein
MMNQSILFSDDPKWNSQLSQIEFSAHNMGNLIVCVVPAAVLERFSGHQIIDEHLALDQFNHYRFDFEELAEQQIDDERLNDKGQVVLS